ncbi:hypothetical protein [Pendulispora albinea]|uniref:Uncharacterized protein n=1 Tax=Pendulispora albinea TaxID=2741071 RepID=A0ABZ2LVJ4_9BACT
MELPNDDTLNWIVTRYADFVAKHGEAIGQPELVQPTGEFFPDDFAFDVQSVARLFERMLSYAPVSDDLEFGLQFVDSAQASGGGGCSSGGCGSGSCATDAGANVRDGLRNGVLETDEGYVAVVNVEYVHNAILLTTSLVRSIGAIVLAEADEEVAESDLGLMSEIAAVASGFGVLLHQGSYVYGKSCGGARVQRATQLSVEELGVALALFTRHHELKASQARGHLDTTQREAFDHALEWVDSNEDIVDGLRERPEEIALGFFEIQPARGLLGRMLSRQPRKRNEPSMAMLDRAKSR